MGKHELEEEISSALNAARAHWSEITALLLESRAHGEPTRELGNKICAAEQSWLMDMARHKIALNKYRIFRK